MYVAVATNGTVRKVIHGADILIVQPDVAVGMSWCDALREFGMGNVALIGCAGIALDHVRARPPAGIVVALESDAASHAFLDDLAVILGAQLDGIPVVLVSSRPTREVMKSAAAAGFAAVLPFPVAPRMIYRRIGSLMQKARRTARRSGDRPTALG